MSNNLLDLPDGLKCPKLQMLLLSGNEGFELIPDAFFAGMRSLKVLDLSERVGVRSLNPEYGLESNIFPLLSSLKFPSSFEVLIKLQVLSLDHCKLDDISILGKLKGLEILSFYGSDIKELPCEIGDLTNLRLLDLTFCQSLERIPEKLISRLKRLEELYMGGCSKLWRVSYCQACLSEIMSLCYLTILCIEVPRMGCRSKTFYFREIKTEIPQAIKNMLQITEDLTLFCLGKGLLRSIVDVPQESLSRLKILKVSACMEDRILGDKRPHNAPIVLGALEELHLSAMHSLENISADPHELHPTYSLRKLRIGNVEYCRHWLMNTLFAPSLVQRILNLEEVRVAWCKELRVIFALKNFIEEEQGIISTGLGSSSRLGSDEDIPGPSNPLSPLSSRVGETKQGHDILLSKLRKINLDSLPNLI